MPNYASNLLLVTGSNEDRKEMLDFIKSEECDFEFNNVIPMPEDLDIDEENLSKEEVEAKKKSNLEKYGYEDWYKWQAENWGCKWGADDVMIEEGYWTTEISFITPWNAPFPIYKELAKRFPNLSMVFYYAEPGMGLYGLGIKYPGDSSFSHTELEDGSEDAWEILRILGYAVKQDEKGKWRWEGETEEEED